MLEQGPALTHRLDDLLSARSVLLRDPFGRFSPQALLCTDPTRHPVQIIRWFILRWQVEVTFQEVCTHLGAATQRQWSGHAVAGCMPCVFGLFLIVTLLAGQLHHLTCTAVLTESWYRKSHPMFTDAPTAVRRQILRETGLLTSQRRHRTPKPSQALQRCLVYALFHAA
ncbi:hypothetical protein AAII07_58305 [Microvirga sp. 0TCS3.31]